MITAKCYGNYGNQNIQCTDFDVRVKMCKQNELIALVYLCGLNIVWSVANNENVWPFHLFCC